VAGIANVIPLTTLLDRIVKNEYVIEVLSNIQTKIQSKTSSKYTLIVKELQARNTELHTYKMKEERSFKVMLRNIQKYTVKVTCGKELQETLTHVFQLELKPLANNKDRYDINYPCCNLK